MADLTLADLDVLNRDIWGDDPRDEPGELTRMVVVLTAVVGDLAKQARVEWKPGLVDHDEVRKELWNLLLTARRCLTGFCGVRGVEGLAGAQRAQRAYVERTDQPIEERA